MLEKSQLSTRLKLAAIVLVCALPSLCEAYAIAWGESQGHTGKALRDGLDFWAGGFLVLHGQLPILFDHLAYQSFLSGLYGKLPYHLWSYPPTYLLLATAFDWLRPWAAVFSFDAVSLAFLAAVLRLSKQSWWLIAAVLLSPAALENLLEHQNAALLTALIGGGCLLLPTSPRLAGLFVGLATIKPQLGLVLPLNLLRRSPLAFAYATMSAIVLASVSLQIFGTAAWTGFLHFTSPAMTAVLLTGQPPDFAGGLISMFALARPLGLHPALAIQAATTIAAILLATRTRNAPKILILAALASPYLHDYDLLGATLAVALLTKSRLQTGFAPGEAILYFLLWFGPGLLPWEPQLAHAAPVLLLLLLASAQRRGGLSPCDSSQAQPVSPALSAGPLPIPGPQNSTAPG